MSNTNHSSIKNARISSGLTQQAMSIFLEIPKRTIENWESCKRNPPIWAEKLIIEKLENIRKNNAIQE